MKTATYQQARAMSVCLLPKAVELVTEIRPIARAPYPAVERYLKPPPGAELGSDKVGSVSGAAC